jgi:RNA recognition motif-containing protein
MRKAAGSIWEDPTLADWPDNDYRLFCGNLGNEVSDEVLANAFRKYASFARARVIRDKRTMKTKGYGFVSFLNPNDYLKAFNEMNGKYVGNRPIKISKGKWVERSFQSKKKDGLDAEFVKPKIRKIKRIQP